MKEVQEEGHQLLSVMFAERAVLPENRAYLDRCLTVTVFKTDKYLKEIKTLPNGIKINCNAGAVTINQMGSYSNLTVWYLPKGITNIFLMHELEKLYRITYNSWVGYYVVHTPKGAVKFYMDKKGLPYIELDGPGHEAAIMLLQRVQEDAQGRIETTLVQTVQGNYKGNTKKDVLKAKEACRVQAMIDNPSKKDYKGMVSGNLITNCPVPQPTLVMPVRCLGQTLSASEEKQFDKPQRLWWQTTCAMFSGGNQQCIYKGGRSVLCGWNSFSINNVPTNQIHHH